MLAGGFDAWRAAELALDRFEVVDVAGLALLRERRADLQILDRDPLENLRNTNSIKYVMKNGRLYDGETLDEIWPRSIKYGDYYWVVPEMYRIDEKRVDMWDKQE